MTVAETGHLVFLLYTNSAGQSIERIVDSFGADEQPQILLHCDGSGGYLIAKINSNH